MLHVQRTVKYICGQTGSYWEVGSPKSRAGNRIVPLTQEAVNILHSQQDKIRKVKTRPIEYLDFVFLTAKGKPLINHDLGFHLHQLCEKAGIDGISVHTLRHTFATRCIEAGMIPKTLQAILGHTRLEMTMDLYVHVTEDKKIQEIIRIEDKINVM